MKPSATPYSQVTPYTAPAIVPISGIDARKPAPETAATVRGQECSLDAGAPRARKEQQLPPLPVADGHTVIHEKEALLAATGALERAVPLPPGGGRARDPLHDGVADVGEGLIVGIRAVELSNRDRQEFPFLAWEPSRMLQRS